MEQEQQTSPGQLLNDLLSNPTEVGHTAASQLKQLVKTYPQSGLLQALYACSGNREALKKTAVYYPSLALYKLAHAPFSFPEVKENQLITVISNAAPAEPAAQQVLPAEQEAEPPAETEDASQIHVEPTVTEETALQQGEDGPLEPELSPELVTEEEIDDVPGQEWYAPDTAELIITDEPEAELTAQHEKVVEEPQQTNTAAIHNSEVKDTEINTVQLETEPAPAAIAVADYSDDDEIYEEIVGIEDINFAPVNQPVVTTNAEEVVEAINTTDNGITAAENAPEQQPETEPVATLIEQDSEPAEDTKTEDTPVGPETESSFTEDALVAESGISAELQENSEFADTAEETQAESNSFNEESANGNAAAPDADNEVPVTEPEAEPSPAPARETERLIIENIAATDYFIFDKAFRDRNRPEPVAKTEEPVSAEPIAEAPAPQPVAEVKKEEATDAEEKNDVSKYHDEKMPYSFMWWLDKTRREHAGIYQPYTSQPEPVQPAAPQMPVVNADKLQHQYIESILHSTPVKGFEPETARTIEFDMRSSKEHKIIERFIQEEPHIKPPSSDKLGSENKAKKSAEDQDELITETLARIYTDQMLYAKAIATYKKLMLKYPEKSSYFAGHIQQLEKKIS